MLAGETMFVAELIRAANQIEKASTDEIKALLFRAIVTGKTIRIPGSGTPADAVISLYDTAMKIEDVAPHARATALLDGAGLLRDLRIVAESGTRLNLWRQDQGELR